MFPTLAGTERDGYRIRAFCVADLADVLRIEEAGAENPWTAERVRAIMRLPDTTGVVAESAGRIVAFAIYSFDEATCSVRRLTVAPDSRRRRAGSALLGELQRQAGDSERMVSVDLSEDALEAQLFLRRCGFVCERAVGPRQAGPRREGAEDSYRFVWTTYRRLIAPAAGSVG